MFNKILVAVDGSKYADRATDAAVDLAKHHQASVILLHVIRNLALPKEIEAMISAGEVTESRLEILQDSAEIILERAEEKLKKSGISDIKRQVLIGDPASTIADYADQNGVDLILIGYQGLDADSSLLGGVARKLTHISKTSCLIVR